MQEFQIFFLERPFPVMLLLVGDVTADGFAMGRTDSERAIAFLPRKAAIPRLLMHPL